MTSRCIVTGHEGAEFGVVMSITSPLMSSYAKRHGVDYLAVEYGGITSIRRPPSWKKLVAIGGMLSAYDEVLWLDADVVVSDPSDNIFDEFPDWAAHAMVKHQTDEGDVPNAGVWLVRRAMIPSLVACAMRDDLVHHRWWEQAAIQEQMGFVERDGKVRHENSTPLYEETHWLDESWNTWTGSPESSRKPRFLHACGAKGMERIELLRRWADGA